MNPERIRLLAAEAIDALTVDGFELLDAATGERTGEHHIPAHQRTIAIDLEGIDSRMGPKGGTMLFKMAGDVVRAVMLLEAIAEEVKGGRP